MFGTNMRGSDRERNINERKKQRTDYYYGVVPAKKKKKSTELSCDTQMSL